MERTSIFGATRKDGVLVRAAMQTPLRKARQSAKLRELRQALVDAGLALDHQAAALGLSRSTAWVLLKGSHKCSGLSPALIRRMLGSTQLPQTVRAIIIEYVEQKASGAYGRSKERLRTFRARLEPPPVRSEGGLH
jgi:hypothetical protein